MQPELLLAVASHGANEGLMALTPAHLIELASCYIVYRVVAFLRNPRQLVKYLNNAAEVLTGLAEALRDLRGAGKKLAAEIIGIFSDTHDMMSKSHAKKSPEPSSSHPPERIGVKDVRKPSRKHPQRRKHKRRR